MDFLHLIKSQYYPYHLSWEEINNPGMVLEKFLNEWDLPDCRRKLRHYQNLVIGKKFNPSKKEHAELKEFLNEFERLIEAVYIIRLQYDEAQKNKEKS